MGHFTRVKESFVCDRCGEKVKGDGYTNHCPMCLWSKHVDIYPGDRLSECRGMMRPVSAEKRGDSYSILHSCTACRHIKKNKLSRQDNFDTFVSLSG